MSHSYPRLVELQFGDFGELRTRLVVVDTPEALNALQRECRRAVTVDWRAIPVNKLTISVGDLMRLMKLP